jgi:hypothetical protein
MRSAVSGLHPGLMYMFFDMKIVPEALCTPFGKGGRADIEK